MSSCICGIDAVARGSYVGGAMPIAAYARENSSSIRYASAHHGSWAVAFASTLSSMSVTLRTNVTRPYRWVSHRRRMSKLSAPRRWPMCGPDWTVGPQTYTVTFEGSSGTKSRRACALVS